MPTRFDVCIVGGAGHVGLPLGLVFASKGLRVVLQDINAQALAEIGRGTMPFLEHGAEPLLEKALAMGTLSTSADPATMGMADAVVITIGTPVDEFLSPNMRLFRTWADSIIPYIVPGQLIVLRSTVYPGTTEWLAKYLEDNGKKVRMAFCPERIVQGHAIRELQELPQLVSGIDDACRDAAAALLLRICPSVVHLSPKEAEFAKLFTNAYRYIQFAAANQFYMIAQDAGVDYNKILRYIKKDYPRARDIPGAGFAAGPCLLKDTMQLAACASNTFSLGHAAMLVNEGIVLYLVKALRQKYELEKMTVGLLGMAFKADCDDTRSSLSYKMKKTLQFSAREVLTTDPFVTGDPEIRPLDEVIARSDLLILCAPHKEYKNLDVKGKELLDMWDFVESNGARA
ncbi:MAG: nucleotide sugar dehydrogenase [Planctomycetota bacterium]|nr:nucleotide sugar dehydrogenase [Planctomycetota bacterium]